MEKKKSTLSRYFGYAGVTNIIEKLDIMKRTIIGSTYMIVGANLFG